MEYDDAVASAPAGWRHFSIHDVDRLPAAVRARELARVPPGEPDDRIVRALFWPLVYHLEPERWDALARSEPIHPSLVEALPSGIGVAIDVGAGSGRLTAHLRSRSRLTVGVEPAAGLRSILARRLERVQVVAAWSDSLPFADGCSDLTAACGAFGPDPRVLDEMVRVTRPGGMVALVNPEQPAWFERHGWSRLTAPPMSPPEHDGWIDDFFGPPKPPRELLFKSVSRSSAARSRGSPPPRARRRRGPEGRRAHRPTS